jgi:hypothetical protein
MGQDQSLERGVESVGEMRKVSYPQHRDTLFAHFNQFVYRFNVGSNGADDGDTVVKPDTTHPLQPGRWEKTPIGAAGGGGGGTFVENEFTATAAQTVFTLSQAFALAGLSILFINGVGYAEGAEYTIAGTTLTWLDVPFALEAGDRVVVKFQT